MSKIKIIEREKHVFQSLCCCWVAYWWKQNSHWAEKKKRWMFGCGCPKRSVNHVPVFTRISNLQYYVFLDNQRMREYPQELNNTTQLPQHHSALVIRFLENINIKQNEFNYGIHDENPLFTGLCLIRQNLIWDLRTSVLTGLYL